MTKKSKLVIVGGPNGAGKTTLALQYAADFGVEYLGADKISAEIATPQSSNVEIESGKIFFSRLDSFLARNESVLIESTLSGIGLNKRIDSFRSKGYEIVVIFVFLESPEFCKERIRVRVSKGGHNVPDADIDRRFWRSAMNFWNLYRKQADKWSLIYNGGERPVEVAIDEGLHTAILDEEYFNAFSRLLGDK